MAVRWRVALVAIIAATVVGGFSPHAVLSAAESTSAQMVQIAESPVIAPVACLDVACGKGIPAPAAPSPAIVLAAVIGGLALAALGASVMRRRRPRVVPLPAGSRDLLFHPPQFS